MTLLDAKQYDPARARRRTNAIIVSIVVSLFCAWLAYHYRDYRERHVAAEFFSDLQNKNYEAAYGVWFHDPDWKQHPQKYSSYQFNDFYRDWGPGGEWGLIKSHAVDCSLSPGGGTGVIVEMTVNNRAEHPYLWVQKSDNTLSFSPTEIQCGNWWAWLTE